MCSGRYASACPSPFPCRLLTVPVPRYVAQPVYRQPAWRDRDRDGVPDWRDRYDNRHDNRYGGRYDHRHDHRAGPPAWRHTPDRDRDGVPDWRDRYDNRR